MASWLIAYDRSAGELLRCEEYASSQEALRARFSVETTAEAWPGLEVVVLSAASPDAIKMTHGRYFPTVIIPPDYENEPPP